MSSLQVAKKIAQLASDKKAENVVILRMNDVVNFCDYFVICSGTTSRHVRAIAEGIDEGMDEVGIPIKFKQGLNSGPRMRGFSFANAGQPAEDNVGHWALLDMGDVVTHIFEGASREFYALDHLWAEATPVEWQ